jgi:hypothetical protein
LAAVVVADVVVLRGVPLVVVVVLTATGSALLSTGVS